MYRQEKFPYVSSLPLAEWTLGPDVPGVRGIFDPFDETIVAKMEKLLADALPQLANEPLLIGYFLANEQAFEDLPRAVPKLAGKHACKRRLVAMLREKYHDVAALNTAWEMDVASFEALADQGLPVATQIAFQDMQAYTELFIETYYQRITESFRKHDPNHMLIGNRWQPGTANNEALCRIAGKYLDVVSVNYYTERVDREFMRGFTSGRDSVLRSGASFSTRPKKKATSRDGWTWPRNAIAAGPIAITSRTPQPSGLSSASNGSR